jgi:protein involved in polysaccharide export with SLBB domain
MDAQSVRSSQVKDTAGRTDPREADVRPWGEDSVYGDSLSAEEFQRLDSSGRNGDTLGKMRKGRFLRHRKPARPEPDTLRYGQKIFRSANPSLFASYVGAIGEGYQLGPGDQLVLTLWGQKEARYELTLDRSGETSVEGIGLVNLNGQTLKSAEMLLKRRFSRIYAGMKNGQVNMDLTMGKLKQIRVFVAGDVVNPGSYLLSGNTNVFNALYQAKGPTDLGSERRIEIVRGNVHRFVDLYEYFFRGHRSAADVLQDGDVVRVPVRGPVVDVRGAVGRPGRYELLASETAKDLFAYCGGLTAKTADQGVLLTRIFDNGRREALTLPAARELAHGKSPARLQDGDSVFVFEGKDPSRQTVSVEGEVRFPGAYPLQAAMTVADLVKMAGGYTQKVYPSRALLTRRQPDSTFTTLSIRVAPEDVTPLSANDRVTFFNRFEMAPRRHVFVSGAVHKPGRFDLDSGMTVKDLVLLAGGVLKDADLRSVRVEYPLDSVQGAHVETFALDLDQSGSGNLALGDGAHVAVPFQSVPKVLDLVTLQGMVAHTGDYGLLSPRERISSLVRRAGGIRPEGYPTGARLFRTGVGRIAINVDRALKSPGGIDDLELRDGDTLWVPQIPATVRVSGRIYNPSDIPWRQGEGWKWYIAMAGGFTDSANEDKVYLKLADGSIQTRDYGIDSLPNPGSEIVVPFRKPPEPVKFSDVIAALGATASLVLTAVTVFILVSKN